MNVATSITVLRLFLAPVFFILFIKGYFITSLIVIVIAFLTDWLDGYVARRFKQRTRIGAILDGLSDKVLLFFVLLGFFFKLDLTLYIIGLIILRDIFVTFFGLIMLAGKKNIKLESRLLGKITTFLQVIAVTFIFFKFPYVVVVALSCALVGLASVIDYGIVYSKQIKKIIKI